MNILLVETSTKLREAIGTSLVTTGGHIVQCLPDFTSLTSDPSLFDIILVNDSLKPKTDFSALELPKTLIYKIAVSKITELKPVILQQPDIWFIQLPEKQVPALSQLITEI